LRTISDRGERYLKDRIKWERQILSVAPILGYSAEDVFGAAARG
jgi:hypothetical protein